MGSSPYRPTSGLVPVPDRVDSMKELLIAECENIDWFSRAGQSCDSFVIVKDAVEPFDSPVYQYFEIWSSQTKETETKALGILTDETIDEIFSAVTDRYGSLIEKGLAEYFERRETRTENMMTNADLGMWPEILEAVQRDLCWAHVEYRIGSPGFFMRLLEVYRKGHWPCGWIGEFPDGKLAVL